MVPKNRGFFGKGGLVKTFSIFFLSAVCCFAQMPVTLGTAGNFAVLASSSVSNTGATVLTGNLGVSANTLAGISGFPPGIVVPPSMILATGAATGQAQTDLTTAYNNAMTQPFTSDLSGQNLGGMTLMPGVYKFDTSAQLSGTLTLTGPGYYIFQIGSTLTTGSNAAVLAINGADAADIFWQVTSSATLGTGTSFIGNILADISITVTTGATVAGGLLARTGSITLDANNVTFAAGTTPGGFGGPQATPVPSSWILVLIGLVCVALYQTRERWQRRLKR
jgi:hypothetical protein